ncbi:MAG: PilZ domain-containing protein [Bdellovibrionales bacterium]|nr:PilZ domain-containing protein [Bdellovibrionales bacterium]
MAKRKYLRAPVNGPILFDDNGDVLRGVMLNISEEGSLLSELSHVPDINLIPMLIGLVQFPDFSSMPNDHILELKRGIFTKKIIRARGKLIRTNKVKSEVDQIFLSNMACQFFDLNESSQKVIRKYVSVFAKNIIFLLQLFEKNSSKGSNVNIIRKIAFLMNYDGNKKIKDLKREVLHDYQSLEGL